MSEVAPAPGRARSWRHLAFARGYLIGRGEPARVPQAWSRWRFGDWTVWHDPRLASGRSAARRGGGSEVAALGTILDAERPEQPPATVLERLAGALGRSEDALLDALEPLGGRFVLLYRARGRTCIVGDAAGTKQVHHYAREATWLSSHAPLIARNVAGAEPIPDMAFKFGFPGLDTRWSHVRLLTPNTRLRLDDMQVARFWPRRALRPIAVEAAVEAVGALMEGTLRHLAARFELHVSVTAGLDSRVTLAVGRDLPMRLFTFYRADDTADDAKDAEFARRLRAAEGRDVRIMRLRDLTMPKGFARRLDKNTVHPHVRALAWALHAEIPEAGRGIHIRSNLSEIGRQFFGRPRWSDPPSGADLARLHYRRQPGTPAGDVSDAVGRFERFAEVTGLFACADSVDLASLFYWEHRMASWFGNALAETDVSIDSVSPYNCRRLLALLLAVPRSDREASVVHRRIVAERAAELTRYPVNGHRLWD